MLKAFTANTYAQLTSGIRFSTRSQTRSVVYILNYIHAILPYHRLALNLNNLLESCSSFLLVLHLTLNFLLRFIHIPP